MSSIQVWVAKKTETKEIKRNSVKIQSLCKLQTVEVPRQMQADSTD